MKFENALYETPNIFINRCYYVLKYFGEPLYTYKRETGSRNRKWRGQID